MSLLQERSSCVLKTCELSDFYYSIRALSSKSLTANHVFLGHVLPLVLSLRIHGRTQQSALALQENYKGLWRSLTPPRFKGKHRQRLGQDWTRSFTLMIWYESRARQSLATSERADSDNVEDVLTQHVRLRSSETIFVLLHSSSRGFQ